MTGLRPGFASCARRGSLITPQFSLTLRAEASILIPLLGGQAYSSAVEMTLVVRGTPRQISPSRDIRRKWREENCPWRQSGFYRKHYTSL